MTVDLHVDGGVAVVRLTNGARRNPISLPMATALADALEQVAADRDVAAVALLADGDHFCVGGDVRAMHAAPEPAEFLRELAAELHRGVRLIPSLPPVVVGVHGWAAGAGFSLVLACDVVVAATTASFSPAYPAIGATPDGGMTWSLPRIVGERQARSLILRNAALSADDAQRLGIVDEQHPDADVDQRVLALAGTLAAGPREALTGIKRLVTESADRSLAEQLDHEAESIVRCLSGPDGREGVAAFLERRSPAFGA